MGRDVPALVFTREDRRRYRGKMQQCLDVLAQMLREDRFESGRPRVGLEIELNLVDGEAEPALRNSEVLEAIADPAWSTELGRFNLEINVPPRRLTQGGPYNTTHVFGTYAYNIGINAGDIGQGAAITLFIFPFLAAIVIVMLRFLRRE